MAKEAKTKKEDKKEVKNVHEVNVTIEGKEWEKAQDAAFKKAQKTAKVDGFRKGKVPKEIYIKNYGKTSLLFEAAQSCLQSAYVKAMEDSKLIPVVQPSVDIKSIDEKKVEYTFKIVTKPELKIKKYKGLKISKEEVEVNDEEVNHELGHL